MGRWSTATTPSAGRSDFYETVRQELANALERIDGVLKSPGDNTGGPKT